MVFEEFEGGQRVGMAMHAGAPPDLVCIYTNCNRVILIDMTTLLTTNLPSMHICGLPKRKHNLLSLVEA